MMTHISTELFSAAYELIMAEDVLSMCADRMEGTAPETSGIQAAILLLTKARKRLDDCGGAAEIIEAGKHTGAI